MECVDRIEGVAVLGRLMEIGSEPLLLHADDTRHATTVVRDVPRLSLQCGLSTRRSRPGRKSTIPAPVPHLPSRILHQLTTHTSLGLKCSHTTANAHTRLPGMLEQVIEFGCQTFCAQTKSCERGLGFEQMSASIPRLVRAWSRQLFNKPSSLSRDTLPGATNPCQPRR